MTAFDIAKNALIIGLENEARIEWDSLSDSDKQIYKNKSEYVEVRMRETIHRMAVDFGLMK